MPLARVSHESRLWLQVPSPFPPLLTLDRAKEVRFCSFLWAVSDYRDTERKAGHRPDTRPLAAASPNHAASRQGSAGFCKPRASPSQRAEKNTEGPQTSYLHCIELVAFLPQIHFPEGTTANGLHYGELLNGGRSRHRDRIHPLPCRRASSMLLLAPRGGLHRRTAQTGDVAGRPPSPWASRDSRQQSSQLGPAHPCAVRDVTAARNAPRPSPPGSGNPASQCA